MRNQKSATVNILERLLKGGINYIPLPHRVGCCCSECSTKQKEDGLRFEFIASVTAWKVYRPSRKFFGPEKSTTAGMTAQFNEIFSGNTCNSWVEFQEYESPSCSPTSRPRKS